MGELRVSVLSILRTTRTSQGSEEISAPIPQTLRNEKNTFHFNKTNGK